MPSAFFIGLGYSVRPLAEQLAREGWEVIGTTRDRAKAMTLPAHGIKPVVWEAPSPLPEDDLERADALIISTGPTAEGCPAAHGVGRAQIFTTTQIVYLSSSGVYGDFGGAWVDEDTPCDPTTDRGIHRLAAEKAWQTIAETTGAQLTLCRLTGIYGPGRSAVDSLRGNTPGARAGLSRRLVKRGHVFNRIHRDDIVRGLHALLTIEQPPDIINFADDEPSPPADPVTYAAELLDREPPPLVRFEDIQAELSPMARSFYAENKRLRNDRLKSLLGELTFPSYREGLAAIKKAGISKT